MPSADGAAFGEHHREMQKQSRLQQSCRRARPINLPVKSAQLPRILKGVKDKEYQKKNIKMYGGRGFPGSRKNEQADEQVQKTDNAKIIFNRRWFFGRLSYQLRLKLAAAPVNPVVRL